MRRFVLDVEGGTLADVLASPNLTLESWATAGTIHHGTVHRNAETGGLRVAFELALGGTSMAELGARVLLGGTALTENWLYRWTA